VTEATLNQDQLFEIAECKSKSSLIKWLLANRVRYTLTRRGRVVTTPEQLNAGLVAGDIEEDYEFGQE